MELKRKEGFKSEKKNEGDDYEKLYISKLNLLYINYFEHQLSLYDYVFCLLKSCNLSILFLIGAYLKNYSEITI